MDSTLKFIMHPVRLRILMSVFDRELTPSQIANLLKDVPQATLYRQINALADKGILIVVNEEAIRGTVEKTFAVSMDKLVYGYGDIETLSKTDLLDVFTQYTMSIMSAFSQYAHSIDDEANPLQLIEQDAIQFQTEWMDLEHEDMVQFLKEIKSVVKKYKTKSQSGSNRRHFFFHSSVPEVADDGE